jgi:hypothetical protein
MTQATSSQENAGLSITDQLNQIGEERSIPRNSEETDAEYGERLIEAIDSTVQKLWGVQDDISLLLSGSEAA